jgi:hypothetical protein
MNLFSAITNYFYGGLTDTLTLPVGTSEKMVIHDFQRGITSSRLAVTKREAYGRVYEVWIKFNGTIAGRDAWKVTVLNRDRVGAQFEFVGSRAFTFKCIERGEVEIQAIAPTLIDYKRVKLFANRPIESLTRAARAFSTEINKEIIFTDDFVLMLLSEYDSNGGLRVHQIHVGRVGSSELKKCYFYGCKAQFCDMDSYKVNFEGEDHLLEIPRLVTSEDTITPHCGKWDELPLHVLTDYN